MFKFSVYSQAKNIENYLIIKVFYTFLFLIILLSDLTFAFAFQKFYHNKNNHCIVTETFINDYEPEQFNSTNNLLRESGALPFYCGQKIIIKGKLLDEKCSPISDAKVYLWQVGCDGKYHYNTLRTKTNPRMLNLDNKGVSTFMGSGVANTNNSGDFLFITVYPAILGAEKPHVNLRAEHRVLGVLQTKFYLQNSNIMGYQEYLNQDVAVYEFNIVMPGSSRKSY